MNKLFFSLSLISLCLLSSINAQSQEIEVNNDMVKMVGDDAVLYFHNNGYLRFISEHGNDWQTGFESIVQSDWGIAIQVPSPNHTSPEAFKVYGNGMVEKNGSIIHSDSTLKTDIEPLGKHTDKLKQLKCFQYHLKADKKNPKPIKRFGLMAQDLEKVYPNLVFTNEKNLKSINYIELIPVLIEVVKEQQAQLEAKEKQYEALVKRIEKLEK